MLLLKDRWKDGARKPCCLTWGVIFLSNQVMKEIINTNRVQANRTDVVKVKRI